MAINKTDVEFMKEYLQYVITFEKSVYIWSNSLYTANAQTDRLSNQKKSLEHDLQTTTDTLSTIDETVSTSVAHKKEEIERCKRVIKKARRPRIIFICVLLCLWAFIALAALLFKGTSAAALVSLPFVAIALVAWSFGSSSEASSRIYSAQTKIAKYTEELNNNAEQNQARRQKHLLRDKANKLSILYQNTSTQLTVAKTNKSKILTTLEKAKNTLRDIYALDVLPHKYRSLNAAVTLYEYLETGRCTNIQGHGGIYDTYEYDLKLGLIISKLDDIINHLEQIEYQQRMLYCELRNANASLSSINKELSSFHESFNNYATVSLEMQRQENATVQWIAWNQWHNS